MEWILPSLWKSSIVANVSVPWKNIVKISVFGVLFILNSEFVMGFLRTYGATLRPVNLGIADHESSSRSEKETKESHGPQREETAINKAPKILFFLFI